MVEAKLITLMQHYTSAELNFMIKERGEGSDYRDRLCYGFGFFTYHLRGFQSPFSLK
jgi:hypothetical protein